MRRAFRLVPPPGSIAGGSIAYRGQDLVSGHPNAWAGLRGRHIAMVHQDPSAALNPLFTVGSQISGTTAAEWGWANRAVPADQLEETVRQMAERIANVPSKILRIKKLGVNRTMDVRGFSTAIRFGQEFDAMLHYSEPVKVMQKAMRERGMREGIDAFNRGEFS